MNQKLQVMDKREQCPDFPFFGARYNDAGCIDGRLYDLDACDDEHNLYEPLEDWPCPFCRTEAFIKQYAEWRGIKYKDARAMVKKLKEKYIPTPISSPSIAGKQKIVTNE